MGKLTDTAIRGQLVPGKYADGDGLYLLVGPTGAKSFVFRFKVDGKERNMGLGPDTTCAMPAEIGESFARACTPASARRAAQRIGTALS